MTKPEPSELTLRGRPSLSSSSKKSSKNSSKGEPLGPGPFGVASAEPLSVWVVEMLTTASCRPSAISATESGPRAKLAVVRSGVPARSSTNDAAMKHERRRLGTGPRDSARVPHFGIDRILPPRLPTKPRYAAIILAEIGKVKQFPSRPRIALAAHHPNQEHARRDRQPPRPGARRTQACPPSPPRTCGRDRARAPITSLR